MKNNNLNNIISDFQNYFRKKKSKKLHDPIFFGNESKYLKQCITSGFVSYVGNFVNIFERKICKYTKSKYSVATSSGTAALHLALNYFKIDKNCEVLIPGFTYVATANAIKYCNSNPNFVDIENENLGVCPIKLDAYLKKIGIRKGKKLINKFTKKHIKALIVVHVYGLPAKIQILKKVCHKYNILLIEDAAEAVGTFYDKKHLGTFGDMGILSFNGNKTITTGGGGVILVKNKSEAKVVRILRDSNDQLNILLIQHGYKPGWLREFNNRYSYDIYIKLINGVEIIIEVDGRQHYRYVSRFKNTNVDDVQKRDRKKEELSGDNEHNLIRLNQEYIWNDKNNWKNDLFGFINEKYENNNIIVIYDCASYGYQKILNI